MKVCALDGSLCAIPLKHDVLALIEVGETISYSLDWGLSHFVKDEMGSVVEIARFPLWNTKEDR